MDSLYRRVGIDAAYRAAGGMFYTVESHMKHLAEAKAGDALYVTTQVLGVDGKRLHVFHRLHRRGHDTPLATAEQIYLHVDTVAPNSAPAQAPLHGNLQR